MGDRPEYFRLRLADDQPLPFPMDADQQRLLRSLIDNGGAVASKGTDRFAALQHMVERGWVAEHFAKDIAGGIHCFRATIQGNEALAS